MLENVSARTTTGPARPRKIGTQSSESCGASTLFALRADDRRLKGIRTLLTYPLSVIRAHLVTERGKIS